MAAKAIFAYHRTRDQNPMLPRVNIVRTESSDYILFSTRDALSAKIYDSGEWSLFERKISKGYCEGIDRPLILDVGANIGLYCVPLARELQKMNGCIYAFEPQRIAFYQLCGNVILNRLDNVFPFQLAIGQRADCINLPDLDYSTSLNTSGMSVDPSIRSRTGLVTESESTYRVEVMPLDDLKLPKPPSLIKIDAEGVELEILMGGERLLKDSYFPLLLVEAWRDDWMAEKRTQLLGFLEKLGYNYLEFGDEIIASHPASPVKHEFSLTDDNKVRMRRRN